MFADKFSFAQLTDFIHREQFQRGVRRYGGHYKIKSSRVGISFYAWLLVN
jgi:hypothetical protein